MLFLIAASITAVVAFYLFATRNFDYWAKKNVKHEPPVPFFGNCYKLFMEYCSITQLSMQLYEKYPNEKVVGFYRGNVRELVIKDPEIIRKILNVDFYHFHKRGHGFNHDKEVLLRNLFHAEGDMWKLSRTRLTPAFTTSKLKKMFPLIVKCAEKMESVAEGIAGSDGTTNVRELVARFSTEFIGACGFGIEMDTINNENSAFRELGKRVFELPVRTRILYVLTEFIPFLRPYFHITEIKLENDVINLVKTIRDQRNGKPIGRNDFIDLLLELEGQGQMVGDSVEKTNPDGTPKQVEITMDLGLMAAQVFVFFAAGFETSSSTSSMTLHLLAYHPEIQREVQEQIDEVLSKYDNKLCYDAISEMTLLDNCFKESMRIMPSVGVLDRVCTRQYTIPDVNITIDPGVKILIPVQALHNDEKYFDNPSEFRPDRFASSEAKEKYKYIYMPFGEGPRNCIGGRLGQMQSLAGLAALLHKFTFEPAPTSLRYPKIDPRVNIVQAIEGGIPLKLKRRKQKTV